MRVRHQVVGCFAALALLAACGGDTPPPPPVLRFGALPDRAPGKVREQHEALVSEVCRVASVSCTLVPAASYEALVDDFGQGNVDVAYFGGATFARAHHRHGAVPLAMRDIDFRFTSVVMVRADDDAHELTNVRGRVFAFGPRSSTSGHVMGRHVLRRAGIDPERDFKGVIYSTGHDETMRLIESGAVGAGVVNGFIAYQAIAAGARLRVLWRSAPYVDYVWAARKELPAALRERLINAFLDMDRAVPAQRAALARQGAAGYVPAYADDFRDIAAVLRERGEL